MNKLELTPSIQRVTVRLTGLMVVGCLSAYLWQGYYQNLWWSTTYVISLLVPFAVMLVAIWIMFVPEYLAFSEASLTIKPRFRALRELPWSSLSRWGKGEGVFCLNFRGSPSIQIFAHAYPPEQWSRLMEFLLRQFPDQKADGFLGLFGVRIGR